MKSSPPKLNRAADAFAAAPAAGAALVAGIAVLGMVGDAVWRGLPFAVLPVAVTMLGAMIFLTAALFLYIAAIVLGYPGYLLCRHKQWTRRIHWILLFAIVDCVAVGALYPLGILLAVFPEPSRSTSPTRSRSFPSAAWLPARCWWARSPA